MSAIIDELKKHYFNIEKGDEEKPYRWIANQNATEYKEKHALAQEQQEKEAEKSEKNAAEEAKKDDFRASSGRNARLANRYPMTSQRSYTRSKSRTRL